MRDDTVNRNRGGAEEGTEEVSGEVRPQFAPLSGAPATVAASLKLQL